MKMVNCKVFKLALFYDWTINNKLKARTLIISTGGFYYRLRAAIYDILYKDDYFDEDD
jgi:hypothetical protein